MNDIVKDSADRRIGELTASFIAAAHSRGAYDPAGWAAGAKDFFTKNFAPAGAALPVCVDSLSPAHMELDRVLLALADGGLPGDPRLNRIARVEELTSQAQKQGLIRLRW